MGDGQLAAEHQVEHLPGAPKLFSSADTNTFVSSTTVRKLTARRARSEPRLSLLLSPRGSCSPSLREQRPFAFVETAACALARLTRRTVSSRSSPLMPTAAPPLAPGGDHHLLLLPQQHRKWAVGSPLISLSSRTARTPSICRSNSHTIVTGLPVWVHRQIDVAAQPATRGQCFMLLWVGD